MDIEKKLALLSGIYRIFDKFASGLYSACRKYCAHCCTFNVSITTLEGFFMIRDLDDNQRAELKHCLENNIAPGRFRPQLTTNHIAELCREGKELPKEPLSNQTLACPLLSQSECPIYRHRPFGCRCFTSKSLCDAAGAADVDDFVLSVDTVFLQTIEHLDGCGCTGNLADVLLGLLDEKNLRNYLEGRLTCHSVGLVANRPLTVLMVPPEYREDFRPILFDLNSLEPPVE